MLFLVPVGPVPNTDSIPTHKRLWGLKGSASSASLLKRLAC